MNNFLNLFLSGTVVSLPSILAAAGILINNSRASSRQKSDRSIKMKLELLEGIYSNFDDISDKFLLTMSSIEKRLFNIQEEVLENASDNELQRYALEMNELAKESLFLAVHKRKILDTYKIKIDADELAEYVVEVTKRIITCADMIVFVTKLYAVKYYETADKSLATQAVIQELKKEMEGDELYNQKLQKIEETTKLAYQYKKDHNSLFAQTVQELAKMRNEDEETIKQELQERFDKDKNVLIKEIVE